MHYGTSAGEGSAGVHSVLPGDTLWSVSNRYNLVMRDIVTHNNLIAPFRLVAGQRLRLPPPREYQVREGDSLYAVSRIFDVSVREIARLNNMREPFTLHPGQVIRLPNENTPSDLAAAPSAKPRQSASVQKVAVTQPVSRPPAPITAKTPPRSNSKFLKPVSGTIISSYGPKKGGLHNDGINIAAARGTPVLAAENGVVVYVGSELRGSGNLVLVRHADRWMSAYAHLDKASVKRGQVLKRGEKLGTVGSTGTVTEPQLHFEIRRGTEAVNPVRYL